MADEQHARRFSLLAAPWPGRRSDWWVDRGRAIAIRTGRVRARLKGTTRAAAERARRRRRSRQARNG